MHPIPDPHRPHSPSEPRLGGGRVSNWSYNLIDIEAAGVDMSVSEELKRNTYEAGCEPLGSHRRPCLERDPSWRVGI